MIGSAALSLWPADAPRCGRVGAPERTEARVSGASSIVSGHRPSSRIPRFRGEDGLSPAVDGRCTGISRNGTQDDVDGGFDQGV